MAERLASEGDLLERDLEAVMTAQERPLLRYATRLLNDGAAAQDVVQEAFIRLFRGWQRGARPAGEVAAWLFRVTHNLAVDHIRAEARRRTLHVAGAEEAERAAAPADAPGGALDREEAMRTILERMKRLSPAERETVLLRLQEGKSYREIAEVTGRSAGHVGRLLHDGLRKLREALRRGGEEACAR